MKLWYITACLFLCFSLFVFLSSSSDVISTSIVSITYSSFVKEKVDIFPKEAVFESEIITITSNISPLKSQYSWKLDTLHDIEILEQNASKIVLKKKNDFIKPIHLQFMYEDQKETISIRCYNRLVDLTFYTWIFLSTSSPYKPSDQTQYLSPSNRYHLEFAFSYIFVEQPMEEKTKTKLWKQLNSYFGKGLNRLIASNVSYESSPSFIFLYEEDIFNGKKEQTFSFELENLFFAITIKNG